MNQDAIITNLLDAFPRVVPEAILLVTACVLFLGSTIRKSRSLWASTALIGIGIAAWFAIQLQPMSAEVAYSSPIFQDRLALLIQGISLIAGAVLVLFSWNEVPDEFAGECHACLVIVVAGLSLAGSANDLVVSFLALELISIPTYILLYLPKTDKGAQEAAMKYFLLSVFSSALLLFGFSYLYGLVGTTNVAGIVKSLNDAQSLAFDNKETIRLPMTAMVAMVMVLAGLGYKITMVPFHFYAPDVYQGAPTSSAALLAFLPKVAGFVVLFRVFGYLSEGKPFTGLALGQQVPVMFWILAAITMTLGNILALLQSNVKRLLAYSSIAHAGYMLIGLSAAPWLVWKGSPLPGGIDAIVFYLMAYGAMTIGAFSVLSYLSTPERPVETEDDLSGLGRSHPAVAALMAVFLFSLIGMPLTAGFVGKLLLFLGAMSVVGQQALLFKILAVIGAINAAIGGWYYLRVLSKMYLHSPIRPLPPSHSWPTLVATVICAVLTLAMGIYPKPAVDLVTKCVPIPITQTASNER